MVAGDGVVQDGHVPFAGYLKQATSIGVAVFCKLQEKLPIMTAMGTVIDVSRNDVSFSTRHAISLPAEHLDTNDFLEGVTKSKRVTLDFIDQNEDAIGK